MRLHKQIFIFSSLVFLNWSCGNNDEQGKSNIETELVVSETPVQNLRPTKEILLPGELYPWDKVSIYSRVQGYIKEIKVDRGTPVKKGQVLAILEAPEIVAELDKAYGLVMSAEAELTKSKSNFTSSQLTYSRLYKTSKTEGAISLNELDLSRSKMLADSSLLVSAEGNLSAARSHYKTKQEMVNYLKIEAPFDGTIIERNVSPGALVIAGDVHSKPLFVIEDNSRLRLTVAIPEIYSGAIQKTDTVLFNVNNAPHKSFKAFFGRSSESILEQSRVMMIEFDVDNSTGELKAGMYAEVNLLIQRLSPTLFVPKSALVDSREQVFIIRSVQNKAEWIPVKKGMILDSLVEVFGLLTPGEMIVLKASEEIRVGSTIKVANGL